MAMLLLALKVLLIAFIVGGAVALVVRAVRRSRANRLDPRWKVGGTQPGYVASAHGTMPNTPLPEWAYWDEDGDEHPDAGRAP
ncbi:hypothetical protein A5709_20210 [Mycobacterium sp. E1386]|uniref:hypothetical protein n=1 Tax=Mycobacterium sp. E1386 TaxID=1834126 RepID=UPI0007FC1A93|nr:hypothetical protein [Mycobacterium sp. E1386]OBI34486.1 hypothetical protein A5709_20210 [Mycobacterium sp. E1386]